MTKQHTFALRIKVDLRKTRSSNPWNSNDYRTVFCCKYWNLTTYNRNRKQLQNVSLHYLKITAAVEKSRLHTTEKNCHY